MLPTGVNRMLVGNRVRVGLAWKPNCSFDPLKNFPSCEQKHPRGSGTRVVIRPATAPTSYNITVAMCNFVTIACGRSQMTFDGAVGDMTQEQQQRNVHLSVKPLHFLLYNIDFPKSALLQTERWPTDLKASLESRENCGKRNRCKRCLVNAVKWWSNVRAYVT